MRRKQMHPEPEPTVENRWHHLILPHPDDIVIDADEVRRGDVVLDMFGGSGSTLIAADLTGRQARLVEYGPPYCDTIIRRWEKRSGK